MYQPSNFLQHIVSVDVRMQKLFIVFVKKIQLIHCSNFEVCGIALDPKLNMWSVILYIMTCYATITLQTISSTDNHHVSFNMVPHEHINNHFYQCFKSLVLCSESILSHDALARSVLLCTKELSNVDVILAWCIGSLMSNKRCHGNLHVRANCESYYRFLKPRMMGRFFASSIIVFVEDKVSKLG